MKLQESVEQNLRQAYILGTEADPVSLAEREPQSCFHPGKNPGRYTDGIGG